MIIGLQFHNQFHNQHKRWKQCKWCGYTFLPHHNKQAFCDQTCKYISRQNYKSNWMRQRRIQHRSGEVVNDRAILNLGTGALGEHCEVDCSVEISKIRKELRSLGLKR